MGLNWWQIVVWVLGLSFGMMGLVLRRGFWVVELLGFGLRIDGG